MSAVRDSRALPVPDGLDGMRVDAGLSKLLGLSRTGVVRQGFEPGPLPPGQHDGQQAHKEGGKSRSDATDH